jgi:hypothetical protein
MARPDKYWHLIRNLGNDRLFITRCTAELVLNGDCAAESRSGSPSLSGHRRGRSCRNLLCYTSQRGSGQRSRIEPLSGKHRIS